MLQATFEGVAVGDVMTPGDEIRVVDPAQSLADVLDRMFKERHTGYPVLDGDRLVGVITLEDIREVDPESRSTVIVEEAMSTDLETVDADTEAVDAMRRIANGDFGRLLVVDETGALVGLVTRSDLVTAMNVIREQRSVDRGTPQPE
jgi:CBS domain-containing protein